MSLCSGWKFCDTADSRSDSSLVLRSAKLFISNISSARNPKKSGTSMCLSVSSEIFSRKNAEALPGRKRTPKYGVLKSNSNPVVRVVVPNTITRGFCSERTKHASTRPSGTISKAVSSVGPLYQTHSTCDLNGLIGRYSAQISRESPPIQIQSRSAAVGRRVGFLQDPPAGLPLGSYWTYEPVEGFEINPNFSRTAVIA